MVEDSSVSFSFGRDEAFGIVEMVDTATVVVSVDDPAALARIQVNRLVAILGTRVGELYIGMVSKIVRKANLDDLWTAGDGVSFANDTVKVLLVGTVREKDGTKKECVQAKHRICPYGWCRSFPYRKRSPIDSHGGDIR